MYCKYCGKEISDDSVFCQFCGKKMNDGTISSINHEKEEPEKKKNYTWIFVLLLIVIGGGGYYFINERIQYVKTHGTINGHEYVDLGFISRFIITFIEKITPMNIAMRIPIIIPKNFS